MVQNILNFVGVGLFFHDLFDNFAERSRPNFKTKHCFDHLQFREYISTIIFDVIEHLPTHLSYEAKLGGHVQYIGE